MVRFKRRTALSSLFALSCAGALLFAACGTSSATPSAQPKAAKGSAVSFIAAMPFTGANDFYGNLFLEPVDEGAALVNANGGILGHPVKVVSANDYSDPADAVTSLRKAEASASNPLAVEGLDSTTGPSNIPVTIASGQIAFSNAGETAYAKYPNPKYLYMMQPPDELQGLAMIDLAHQLGYKHPAIVTTNDPASASIRDGILFGLRPLGLKSVDNLIIAPDQATYATEVNGLLAKHPDALVLELPPATAAKFLGDVTTATGGTLKLPIVSDTVATSGNWPQDVAKVIGASTLKNKMQVAVALPPASPSNASYHYLASHYSQKFADNTPFAPAFVAPIFDTVLLTALAAAEAKSLSPAKFAPYIAKLDSQVGCTDKIGSYPAALTAIKQGKHFCFIGATGGYGWNSYHVRTSSYQVDRVTSNATLVPVGVIAGSQLSTLLAK